MPTFLLVIFAVLPWLGENIYSPGLPLVAEGLGLTPSEGEWTLTTYIWGLVGGVFLWGPISDRIGRRRAVVCGLLVFLCACVTSFLTPLPSLFFIARFVQGLGASALLVTSQTLVRQGFEGAKRAHLFASIGLAIGIAPAIGPLIGGFLVEYGGWRSTFLVLMTGGLILLGLVCFQMPAYSPAPGVRFQLIRWPVLKAVLQDGHLLACALVSGLSIGASYSLFSEGPSYFLTGFGFSPAQFGSCFLLVSCGQIVGGIALKILIRRVSVLSLMRYGACLQVCVVWVWWGCVASGLLQSLGWWGGVGSACFLGLMALGNAFLISNALAIGLNEVQKTHPITCQYLGTTTSYYAALHNAISASLNGIVGLLHTGSLLLLPGMYCVTTGIILFLTHKILKTSE